MAQNSNHFASNSISLRIWPVMILMMVSSDLFGSAVGSFLSFTFWAPYHKLIYNQDFWPDFGNFFDRNEPFLLFESNFTSKQRFPIPFWAYKVKIFRFNIQTIWLFSLKLFLGKVDLAQRSTLSVKLFWVKFFALTEPPVYCTYRYPPVYCTYGTD